MFYQLSEDIQRALFTFEKALKQAVLRRYPQNDLLPSLLSESSSMSMEENRMLAQSGVQESLFLLY